MLNLFRGILESIGEMFQSIYWNIREFLSALNPFPALRSLFSEIVDLTYAVREGLTSFFRGILALPLLLGHALYRMGRFIVLLPLELASLVGIGESRLGFKERLISPISAVSETIGGITETMAELQPKQVGARLTEETKDVSWAMVAGVRKAFGALIWAPFGFLYFIYDLICGIGTLPARLKSAVVNRTRKQLIGAGVFIAFSGGCLFLVYNVWTTRGVRNSQVAKLWQQFDNDLRQLDSPKALATLEKLYELQPRDQTVQKRLQQLREEKPSGDDEAVLRMFMRKRLSDGAIDGAADLARRMIVLVPEDWEGNLILAHEAVLAKKLDVARQFIAKLPESAKFKQPVGPGAVLYAAQIFHQVGAQSNLDDLIDYFIYRLLPAVNNFDADKWPLQQKMQVVDCYLLALERLEIRPGLTTFWVPIQRVCRWIFEDPKLDLPSLTRLGMAEEAQFNALQAFKNRKLIEEVEYLSSSTEVETRLGLIWNEILKRDPKNVRAYTAKSLARFRANDIEGALAILGKGIEACGPKVELVSAKSQLLRIADPAVGYEFAKVSAQNDPKSLPLLAILAESSIKAGRLDEALTACQQAVNLQPDLDWANRLIGQICLEMKRPTEAIVAYRRILKSIVSDPKTASDYVRALCSLGLYSEAEKFVSTIPVSTDSGANVVAQCSEAFIRSKRPDLAEKQAKLLLERRPSHLGARLIHADLLRIKAESGSEWNADLARQAVDEYRTILLREPNNLAVVNNAAWLELKALKQPEKALRTAEPLRANEEGTTISAEMLETLGAIYLANNMPEKARIVLGRAVARGTPRASFFMHLCDAHLRLKMKPQAELYFMRAKQFPATPIESRELNDLAIRIRGNQ